VADDERPPDSFWWGLRGKPRAARLEASGYRIAQLGALLNRLPWCCSVAAKGFAMLPPCA